MTPEEVTKRFKFSQPNSDRAQLHKRVNGLTLALALELNEFIDDSREFSLAMTALEEVRSWGNAAIARNQ
jgi:hypothetical protein